MSWRLGSHNTGDSGCFPWAPSHNTASNPVLKTASRSTAKRHDWLVNGLALSSYKVRCCVAHDVRFLSDAWVKHYSRKISKHNWLVRNLNFYAMASLTEAGRLTMNSNVTGASILKYRPQHCVYKRQVLTTSDYYLDWKSFVIFSQL
jgi:hypothetical protein